MIIKRLEIAGLRAFRSAEFTFEPGMNLIVGLNGVGKTTALDALRVVLSRVLPGLTASKSPKVSFTEEDIRLKSDSLKVSCRLHTEGTDIDFLLFDNKTDFIVADPKDLTGKVIETPDKEKITPALHTISQAEARVQPLGLYFSTRRSLAVEQQSTTVRSGQSAAYAEGFSVNRDFNVREIADWMEVQEYLGQERQHLQSHLTAVRYAAAQFLPEYKNLHVVTTDKKINRLQLEKDGETLSIKQLSDGERGMLALALDIARRLSIANPGLENPVRDGKGVILIDELELHLHPKWQRTVTEQLTRTFPNCQFIVTTHSPQIIPTVDADRVQVVTRAGVIFPEATLGMDTNRILRHIMETEDRPAKATAAIDSIEALIAEGEFEKAREEITAYEQEGLELAEWSVFEARMARIETFADEEE